jgi:diguanylate cyclase (GGDEF)-like protein
VTRTGAEPATPGPAGLEDLRAALAPVRDVPTACRAVVDFLLCAGYPMPAVYLVQGGRLRCHAVAGHWQVIDGVPPGEGLVGRVYRTGRALTVADAQAGVPVRIGAHVAGVVQVESGQPLPADTIALLTEVAEVLGGVLMDLWRPWRESPMRRLARHAVVLASAPTWKEAVDRVLDAACDLTGMSTAVLALMDGRADTGWQICAAVGPLTLPLAGLREHELAEVARWISWGTSSWTTGEDGGLRLPGHEALRQRGVRALAAVPLDVLGHRLGLLLVCDEEPTHTRTHQAEPLELLGALAAGALRTWDAVRELGEMATRDPLTGLGHHGRFYADLRSAQSNPSASQPAVLLLDVDRFKDVNDSAGHLHGDLVLRRTAQAMSGALRASDRAYRIGGDEFAAILGAPIRDEDVRALGERVRTAVSEAIDPVTVSLGFAVGAPGEGSEPLVSRADEALYAAKRAGRDAMAGSRTARHRITPTGGGTAA